MRQRLGAHRDNPACASCHRTIDPVGFALENFDAVGRWRDHDGDSGPIDVSGALPGAGEFNGVAGLEEALLQPSGVVRGKADGKAVDVCAWDEAWSTTMRRRSGGFSARPSRVATASRRDPLGIVKSVPFQMRRSS